MSYKPLDIVLDDLQSPSHTFSDEGNDSEPLDTYSVYSESSAVFDNISKAAASPIDLELGVDSKNSSQESECNPAKFENLRFLKKHCSLFGLCVASLWLVALIAYSNVNLREASSAWRSKSSNVVTILENRKIVLNLYEPTRNNVTLESYRKGLYRSRRVLVRWLKPIQFPQTPTAAGRGFYLTKEKNSFLIRQVDSLYKETLLESTQFSFQNTFIYAENLILNPALSVNDPSAWHLIVLDSLGQWRHSKFSLYWLWKPATNEYTPLRNPKELHDKETLEKLHFAEFDPTGKFIVYGFEHDLYIVDLGTLKTKRITSTGSPEIFNGKSDWVYEEEVNSSDKMIWWSPDLKYVAFASLNDSLVHTYILDYYTNPMEVAMSYDEHLEPLLDGLNQYPHHLRLKYPKPGSSNPIVSIYLYNTESEELSQVIPANIDLIGEDFLLYDAAWIDEKNFLLKVSDRTSTIEQKQIYVNFDEVQLVSSCNTSSYGRWVEKSYPIALVVEENKAVQYLDRVIVDNIVQLAIFENATSSSYKKVLGPVTLTSNLVYDNIEHAVYGVFGTDLNLTFGSYDLNSETYTPLTENGNYEVYFSQDGGFVNLMYLGPNEPWQKLMNMGLWANNGLNHSKIEPIDNVKQLSSLLSDTNLPTRIRSKVLLGFGDEKISLNIVEILPPNFQEGKKYPLLVHAYGGPGSITIDDSFDINFQDIVSTTLNAIVLIIEPRGTGRDDWNSKSFARGNIGYWEPRDITAITKKYIKTTGFVDKEKTAIWGWSYGGFTTLRTLEFDKGATFKYGMAVAPVTNWMFYDSIYTERYMKLPFGNANYATARINEFKEFASVKRFLIMHGTADDNVHIQNSMWLLDKFNIANVENFDVYFFPDSEHSIYHHNANKIVYDKLLGWLQKAFMGIYV